MKGPLSPEWPLQGPVGWRPVWDARGLGQPYGDVLRPLASRNTMAVFGGWAPLSVPERLAGGSWGQWDRGALGRSPMERWGLWSSAGGGVGPPLGCRSPWHNVTGPDTQVVADDSRPLSSPVQ